ncbi:hypothetical protein Bpfe_010261, partial [Biomphalaria pfeifferi]
LQRNWFALAMALGVIILLGQQFFLSRKSMFPRRSIQQVYDSQVIEVTPTGNKTFVLREFKKWIVVDALTTPCDDVAGFMQNDQWAVVVVTESPVDLQTCNSPGCIQLTWEMCKRDLGRLETVQALTQPSILCGYLLAMVNGAKVIADASCDVPIRDMENTFGVSEDKSSGLWYNTTSAFNPFEHWGLTNTYPQEYELLNMSTPSVNSHVMYVSDLSSMTIKQGVAISKKTCVTNLDNPEKSSLMPVNSPVAIGANTLVSLQTGPTIFSYDSFPSMLLPRSETRDQMLFRTLLIYVLKKMKVVNFAYYKVDPMTPSKCDVHESAGDKDQSFVLQCVNSIECDANVWDETCLRNTVLGVFECLNLGSEAWLLNAWMTDLEFIGFKGSYEKAAEPTHNVFGISYNFNKEFMMMQNNSELARVEQHITKNFSRICSSPLKQSMWEPVITDILLVVIINYETLYSTIPYMEYVHRRYFKYLMYCGPSLDSFVKYSDKADLGHVTFVSGMTRSWLFMYECVTHAMKLRLPVKGYMQMGEDVLVNTWLLASLPKDQIWIPGGFTKRDMYKINKLEKWYHWNSPVGQRGVINAFATLTNSSVLIPDDTSRAFALKSHYFAKRFLSNYKSNLGVNYIIHRATDLFYIPDVLRDDYIMASELFRQHQTMIEIALPVIHYGLSNRKNITYLKGASLWAQDRLKPWTYYHDTGIHFVHPVKLKMVTNSTEGKDFICETYLSKYVKESDVLRLKL